MLNSGLISRLNPACYGFQEVSVGYIQFIQVKILQLIGHSPQKSNAWHIELIIIPPTKDVSHQ